MKIKPLTGQVLVFMIPEKPTEAGIVLPENVDPDSQHPARQAIVKEIGPWPKLKNGMALIPSFGKGAKVLVHSRKGEKLRSELGQYLRLVRTEDIIALLS